MLTREEAFNRLENSAIVPDMPAYACEVLAMLDSPDEYDLDDLAALIEKNPDIAGFFLRQLHKIVMAEFSTVRDAVYYLGANSSRNILIFFIISLFYKDRDANKKRKFDMQHYWFHVLATSIAAETISEHAGVEDPFRLFTYGLLHDIGVLALDSVMPEELDAAYAMLLGGSRQIIAEKTVFGGLTHAEVGGWLCRRWKFAADIVTIVEHHHSPYLAKELTEDLKILYVADLIGTRYYEKLLSVGPPLVAADRRILAALNMTEEDMAEIGAMLPEKIETFQERFVG